MTTHTPVTLPKLWWLNPWLHVRKLHRAVIDIVERQRENDRFGRQLVESLENSKAKLIEERESAIAGLKLYMRSDIIKKNTIKKLRAKLKAK